MDQQKIRRFLKELRKEKAPTIEGSKIVPASMKYCLEKRGYFPGS